MVQAAYIPEFNKRLGGLQAPFGLPFAVHELEQGFVIAQGAQPPNLLSALLFFVFSAVIGRSVVKHGDLPFGSRLQIKERT